MRRSTFHRDNVSCNQIGGKAATGLSLLLDAQSPDELRAELPDARIAGAVDDSEDSGSTADIPARILELRVVENVEEFSPNLEGHRFSDGGPLHKPEIGIVESRAMEEPAVGRPKRSESAVIVEPTAGRRTSIRVRLRERRPDEVAPCPCRGWTTGSRLTWVVGPDISDEVRHIRVTTGKRKIPVALPQRDGKPSGQAGDTLHLPTLSQAFRRSFEGPIKRHDPHVAGYEIVGYVG